MFYGPDFVPLAAFLLKDPVDLPVDLLHPFEVRIDQGFRVQYMEGLPCKMIGIGEMNNKKDEENQEALYPKPFPERDFSPPDKDLVQNYSDFSSSRRIRRAQTVVLRRELPVTRRSILRDGSYAMLKFMPQAKGKSAVGMRVH